MTTRHFLTAAAVGTPIVLAQILQWTPGTSATPTIGRFGDAIAQARPLPKYRAPANRRGAVRTEGGGARGCLKSIPVTLTLLVPRDHIGQSASAHPTFSWYVSNPAGVAVPMQFALVEPGVAQPLYVKSLQAKTTGLMQVVLPEHTPQLQPGKLYRWTVSMVCNRERPSENAYAIGWIDRVNAHPSSSAIATMDPEAQAVVYADQGQWYDALSTLTQATMQQPSNGGIAQALSALLTQVGLENVPK